MFDSRFFVLWHTQIELSRLTRFVSLKDKQMKQIVLIFCFSSRRKSSRTNRSNLEESSSSSSSRRKQEKQPTFVVRIDRANSIRSEVRKTSSIFFLASRSNVSERRFNFLVSNLRRACSIDFVEGKRNSFLFQISSSRVDLSPKDFDSFNNENQDKLYHQELRVSQLNPSNCSSSRVFLLLININEIHRWKRKKRDSSNILLILNKQRRLIFPRRVDENTEITDARINSSFCVSSSPSLSSLDFDTEKLDEFLFSLTWRFLTDRSIHVSAWIRGRHDQETFLLWKSYPWDFAGSKKREEQEEEEESVALRAEQNEKKNAKFVSMRSVLIWRSLLHSILCRLF